MAQTKLGGGRNRGKSREEGEKKMNFREEGEIGSKSREEGEIGPESREKGVLPPCSTPLFEEQTMLFLTKLAVLGKSVTRTPFYHLKIA